MRLIIRHRKTEKLQEQMTQSLLDRLYGRKSEESKYHPDQALLFPELLEMLTGEVDDEPIDASEPEELQRMPTSRTKVSRDVDVPNCETYRAERPILRIEKSERLEYVLPVSCLYRRQNSSGLMLRLCLKKPSLVKREECEAR